MLKKRFFKTKSDCEVTFEMNPEGVQKMALVCQANEWEPVAMKRAGKGPFKTRIRLPKDSEFEFRYLVDQDQWLNDDSADAYRTNEHGSQNSVVVTTP